jgi:hypothetical protein
VIAYKDFVPKSSGVFFSAESLKAAFDVAVSMANEWVESDSVEVINIETVGNTQSPFFARSVRIWYRAAGGKLDTVPEV